MSSLTGARSAESSVGFQYFQIEPKRGRGRGSGREAEGKERQGRRRDLSGKDAKNTFRFGGWDDFVIQKHLQSIQRELHLFPTREEMIKDQ